MSLESSATSPLSDMIDKNIGRHVNKVFDWDAFPSNRGFSDLERAQMRYVGAGGSPKANDESSIKPEHFTVSLIHMPVGKYAACHSHEIEESFLILSGVLTVGWEKEGEVVEVRLGPKDMILNVREVGHGFRNDGIEPVLMSISVDVGNPLPPCYLYHPKNCPPELARSFGALPGKTLAFDRLSSHPLQKLMAKHVIRHNEQPTIWDPAGFTRKTYVGPGGVQPTTCRKEMLGVPPGTGVKPYAREVEEAFLVIEGSLTVGWQDGNQMVERELGPRDLVVNPAGRYHWFRNNGVAPCVVWSVIGEEKPEALVFEAA